MPSVGLDQNNKQGGKAHGAVLAKQEQELDDINQEFASDEAYNEDEDGDLQERLTAFKKTFISIDREKTGTLDLMDMKLLMERLGQAKTHLELKKMIAEVDTTNSGTINYRDFLRMMLGKKNSVLKLILMFEEKKKEKERPKGPPPKKDLSSLP